MSIELTAREKAVLGAYARGRTDKQIQAELHLSASAVGHYGQRLRGKFAGYIDIEGNARVQLAQLAVEAGLAKRPERIPEIVESK